ncbi:CPBP family intramembrane glutamic endopeptidase [Elizabethkingia meningoseptica]|uniref:CPBP family intramembrane glutamic endopeptidase n=1 Tax=Elizabethkingia meningoseptica TaxID=238 RepID=UPI00099B20E6|nr:CPBP family intramembrane glutamic endopeptidase [Elizabethkingia meningoseptica]MEC4713065.1 CPBP family intramembrane glutamic endopeptidase [Elizabethkingia meningoseptica]OPB94881.1 hypothetical protein BAS10_10860 [Elizabethkingia meningoseptica]
MVKNTLFDFLNFVKKPNDFQLNLKTREKLTILFLLFSLEIIFVLILVLPIQYGIGYFLDLKTERINYKEDTLFNYLTTYVLVVPLIEEILFRYILRYGGIKSSLISRKIWDKIFPFLVYISCLIFGFIHLGNYVNEKSNMFYILSPLIILSQLSGGFVLSYMRVRLGFFWGILYHWLWNFIFIVLISLPDIYFNKPYVDQSDHYKLEINEIPFFQKDKPHTIRIDSLNGKIYKIKIEQYSMQHLLDTISVKDKYYVDDVLMDMKLDVPKGITKDELIKILQKEYSIK